MKSKLLALIAAFMLMANFCYSQESADQDISEQKSDGPTFEVYAGYGTPSLIPTLASMFASMITSLAGADDVDGKLSGVIHAGINWCPTNWLLLGAYASHESFRLSYDDKISHTMRLMTLQARLTLQYGFSRFKFYHGINAGLGITAGLPEATSGSFIFGFTPIGIKVYPTERLSIFAETGFISNAFFSAGVGFKF